MHCHDCFVEKISTNIDIFSCATFFARNFSKNSIKRAKKSRSKCDAYTKTSWVVKREKVRKLSSRYLLLLANHHITSCLKKFVNEFFDSFCGNGKNRFFFFQRIDKRQKILNARKNRHGAINLVFWHVHYENYKNSIAYKKRSDLSIKC